MDDGESFRFPRSLRSPGTRLNGIYEIEPDRRRRMGEIYKGHAIQTGDPVAIE